MGHVVPAIASIVFAQPRQERGQIDTPSIKRQSKFLPLGTFLSFLISDRRDFTLVLWPSPSPSQNPAPSATTFLTAPHSSTPMGSGATATRKHGAWNICDTRRHTEANLGGGQGPGLLSRVEPSRRPPIPQSCREYTGSKRELV
jgi:hypothetical protein